MKILLWILSGINSNSSHSWSSYVRTRHCSKCFTHINPFNTHTHTYTKTKAKPHEVDTSIHFYMRKLEHTEIMYFTQSHTVKKWWNQDSNPGKHSASRATTLKLHNPLSLLVIKKKKKKKEQFENTTVSNFKIYIIYYLREVFIVL